MTDTKPLAPTNAEIVELMRDGYNYRYNDEADHVDFARAVLARWGQPAHSVEPVGYLYCGGSYGDELAEWEIVAEQLQCDRLNEHHGALGKEARLPLYTAPQPVEREPLTHAQAKALVLKYGNDPLHLVLQVERAHGIKGGKT